MVLTHVRPWAGGETDVTIVDGTVATGKTSAKAGVEADTEIIDGHGRLIIPSFADVHTHLDSTRLGLPYRPQSGQTSLMGRVMNDRNNWRGAEASISDRSTYALSLMIANGVTHVRSHVQIDADCKFERLEGVLAAKAQLGKYADVQLVAFPQAGLLREPGNVDLLDEALNRGIDLVGGIDPSTMDGDSKGHLDAVFALARKHSTGIDIHIHEPGALGIYDINRVLDRVEEFGMQGKVNISHAMALESEVAGKDKTIERMGTNRVTVTNVAPSHGVLPIKQLLEHGVRVGLGMDGQRDYWHAYGNGDMLQRTWQLSFTHGWDFEEDITLALKIATWGGYGIVNPSARPIWDDETPGFAPGDPGDFLMLDANYLSEAVMDWPTVPRTLLRAGQLVDFVPRPIV
ncbi:amidohydrolase family protein [Bifidobacterium subtile]|nr:amidohydrolase family protein [Bifidobacterium subtile]QOL37732.1 amidohydrolase family protein [Bifidobacterium subtile]